MEDFSSMYYDFQSTNTYGMGLHDINNLQSDSTLLDSTLYVDNLKVINTENKETVIEKNKTGTCESNITNAENSSLDFLNELSETDSNSILNNLNSSQNHSSVIENIFEPDTPIGIDSLSKNTNQSNDLDILLGESQTPCIKASSHSVSSSHSALISVQSTSRNLCKVKIVKRVPVSMGSRNHILETSTIPAAHSIITSSNPASSSKSSLFSASAPSINKTVLNETSSKEPEEVKMENLRISISNVVASFKVRCHLNLRKIALEGINVVYQRETKKIVMKLREPSCTAYVWSSGRIVCTGAGSEELAKKAARKFARRLQKMGFQVTFSDFKVINVLAVCRMPYAINIVEFSKYYSGKYVSYEPELHPAVTYRIPEWKVSLKIFSTGSITLTSPNVPNVRPSIEKILPLVKDFFRYDVRNRQTTLPEEEYNSDDEGNL